MKFFPCFGVFALLLSGWLGNEAFAAKAPLKHAAHKHGGSRAVRPPEPVITDSSSEAAWRKKLPWLYRDSAFSVYRDTLLRPLFKRHGLGPGNLYKRGGFVEAVFPRGRPLREYAWEVESLSVATGIRVEEGREFDPPQERMEYTLRDASGAPFPLRLTLGKTLLAGSVRMALVVISLDSAGDAAAKRLLTFPVSLTFAVSAGDSAPVPARWANVPSDKEILLELPMEPANYPYVKPGPGALFIHHSRAEVERLMTARLKTCPAAAGFATTYGDRAIENRPLMENMFRFTAARSLLFLDLTGSSRSLTASVALETGAIAYSVRIQEPDSGQKFEAELLRRCDLAGRTGEGIWVLRYFPGLPALLENLLSKNQKHFEEMGLEMVPLSALRRKDSAKATVR
jgi:polysaccharide deacetylase 2 family uncharacterized protein YibQ